MFIKRLSTILLVAILLACCAPLATALPATPIPAPARAGTLTPFPTVTPAPTATATVQPTPVTYIEGLDHVPMPKSAFIEQVVSENYLHVMGLSRAQVELTYSKQASFVAMLDKTNGVPLAVYVDGKWQKGSLKFFGNQAGLVTGTQ